jgi:hypothetical protein
MSSEQSSDKRIQLLHTLIENPDDHTAVNHLFSIYKRMSMLFQENIILVRRTDVKSTREYFSCENQIYKDKPMDSFSLLGKREGTTLRCVLKNLPSIKYPLHYYKLIPSEINLTRGIRFEVSIEIEDDSSGTFFIFGHKDGRVDDSLFHLLI